ncbi:hypothetical protein OG468_00860 [Streptomyces zaomyceticus]|uniref:hypothetical protein n=1 Tax=Streptomyces zaomyceticus TaxID=68286 RepID=UPI00324714C3
MARDLAVLTLAGRAVTDTTPQLTPRPVDCRAIPAICSGDDAQRAGPLDLNWEPVDVLALLNQIVTTWAGQPEIAAARRPRATPPPLPAAQLWSPPSSASSPHGLNARVPAQRPGGRRWCRPIRMFEIPGTVKTNADTGFIYRGRRSAWASLPGS